MPRFGPALGTSRRARSFEIELETSAVPERLFDLLSDAPSWPRWFKPAREVRWIRQANDGQEGGVGAVRRVAIGPVSVNEEVTESERPVHHAYRICTIIPVRDHRADVWLTGAEEGTRIRWTTSFTAKVPGTGPVISRSLRYGVHRLALALIAAAESDSTTS